jgi:hypothetical protein
MKNFTIQGGLSKFRENVKNEKKLQKRVFSPPKYVYFCHLATVVFFVCRAFQEVSTINEVTWLKFTRKENNFEMKKFEETYHHAFIQTRKTLNYFMGTRKKEKWGTNLW